jgi:hypothetical protein
MSTGKAKNGRPSGSDPRREQTDKGQPHPVLTPLTTGQAERLVRLAEEAVAKRGFAMRYDGAGTLVPVGSDGASVAGGATAGLGNLALTVANLPRQQWRSAVEAHFDQMPSLHERPPLPDDLEKELYLRLVCADTIDPEMGKGTPEFMPGILTVPATYMGRAVAMHFDIDSLGVSRAEATRLGLANLRSLRDEVDTVSFDGAEIALLSGSMFTASRALVFDTVLRESLQVENPPFGCLVAMPARDQLYVHVIRDRTMLNALHMLVTTAIDQFNSRPGALSPHVYYIADQQWHQVTDYSTGEFHLNAVSQLEAAAQHLIPEAA